MSEFVDLMKAQYERRRAAGSFKKDKDLFAHILRDEIAASRVKIGQSFTIRDLVESSGLSRSSVIEGIEPLIAEGYIAAEQGKPYQVIRREPAFNIPRHRANVISITDWAHSSGLQIKTVIKSVRCGSFADLKHRRAWEIMGKHAPDDRLVEIRRIRSLCERDGQFRRAISEVSYFNLDFVADVEEFYKNPKNAEVSYHQFFRDKAFEVLRSEYHIAARHLHETHHDAWFESNNPTTQEKYYPFLRVSALSFCKGGPLEFSQSFFDSRVLTIDATSMELKWVGQR